MRVPLKGTIRFVFFWGGVAVGTWAFIRVPSVNPTILGGEGPGFLNQVPTFILNL